MSNLRTGVAISHRDQLPSSSRYELLVKIASGGMATVYVGRLSSVAGVSRLVAVKRAHAHLLEDGSFAKMLVAEARLASKIHHPNVVAVHNVEEIEGELLLVMDYVEGASLHELAVPPDVAVRVVLDACAGLHAAHELADDDGRPLGIVHRDVSPHNILVGIDGIARLTDFGIAKSSGHTQSGGKTSTGALKGKVSYMAPEYVESGHLDARSDVFSLGVCAWEALTHRRLFRGASEVETLKLVLATHVPKDDGLPRALSNVLARALARSPAQRHPSAAAFGEALEAAAREANLVATHAQVAAFVRKVAGDALATRRALIRDKGESGEGARALTDDDGPIGRTEATASVAMAREYAAPARDLEPTKIAPRVTPRLVDAPPRSNRTLLVASAIGAVLAVGVVVVQLRPRSEEPVSSAASAPSASVASPEPSPAPTSAPAPIAAEPIVSASQVVPAKQPPQPTRNHAAAPRAPVAAVSKPAAAPPPAPAPPPLVETPTTTASDRAPPNPYAR
jgi:eukaryotic-like serine/threonine-protein kinase